MAKALATPFRFLPNGSVATVEQDTEEGDAQEVAFLVLTVRGERLMDPDYGLTDPAFVGVDVGEVAAQVARYVPDVSIHNVVTNVVDDATFNVRIEFSDTETATALSDEQGLLVEP